MNEIGRHVTLAIVKYQERGAKLAYASMENPERYLRFYYQRESAIEYATARKLMGVE